MDEPVLKWRERSRVKTVCKIKQHPSIGFKFKKRGEYISFDGKYFDLKDEIVVVENKKLEKIRMENGIFQFHFIGTYNERKVYCIESYDYTTYRKNIPNLFNFL